MTFDRLIRILNLGVGILLLVCLLSLKVKDHRFPAIKNSYDAKWKKVSSGLNAVILFWYIQGSFAFMTVVGEQIYDYNHYDWY